MKILGGIREGAKRSIVTNSVEAGSRELLSVTAYARGAYLDRSHIVYPPSRTTHLDDFCLRP
jgi:hypothetical protein